MDEIALNLKKAERQLIWAAEESLIGEALKLQGQAVRRAPVDTGDLRASGQIGNIEKGLNGMTTIDVHFEMPYAEVQHEETEWKHPRGGQAKYLERPFNNRKAFFQRNLGKPIKDVLGWG